MIPLFHDLRDELVVIFGGGTVARRKTAVFESEASVIVVSESFHEDLFDSSARLIRAHIEEPLAESIVEEAFLVIPATDDEALNEHIEAIARGNDCLVNSVDHPGDTITPSMIQGQHVTVAFSTRGQSPAVSKYLRRRLEPELDRADTMVEIQSTLRSELVDRDADDRRDRLWRVLEDERIWKAIDTGNQKRAESLAREHL